MDAGWLIEHPAVSRPGGGRPALRVGLNGRAAPVLGIDLGPHRISTGVVDAAGVELATARRMVRRRGAEPLLRVVEEAVDEVLSSAHVPLGEVAIAVVGTPGIVDPHSGSVSYAPSLPGWAGTDVAGRLPLELSCPVLVENDANLAALAVAESQGCEGTVLAIQWGERLGAGLTISGRLHRGTGAAGEIGFIRHGNAPRESDGRGPLEASIGAEAIVTRARAAVGDAREGAERLFPDAAAVFSAAADGRAEALQVVRDVARELSEALAPALLVLCPDAVIVSGGVARAGSVLLDAMRSALDELTLIPARVEISTLAETATLKGALRLGLDEVWQRSLDDSIPGRGQDGRPRHT